MSGISPDSTPTLQLGPVPLDYDHLKLAKDYFDAALTIPLKAVVPRGYSTIAEVLLHQLWGDLAGSIAIEWHDASMSWALLNNARQVRAEWPPFTHHQFPSRGVR